MDSKAIVEHAHSLLDCHDRVEGFTVRPQQRALADSLVRGLVNGGQLLLEAPTGTGKTLAYLAGALALAQATDRKLVLATGSVTLQRQLMERELPAFIETTGAALLLALAKGRSRWACPERLKALSDRNVQRQLSAANVVLLQDEEAPVIASRMLERLATGEWSGDLDEWRGPFSAEVASRLTSTRESCSGRRCASYSSCPYQRMRRSVMGADVIVANQNLLLSDLDLGGGRLLPPPESCLVVIDEAHGLPRRVLNQAARSLDFLSLNAHLGLARRLHGELDRAIGGEEKEVGLGAVFRELSRGLESLQDTLARSRLVARSHGADERQEIRLLPGEPVTDFVTGGVRGLLPLLERLMRSFRRHSARLEEAVPDLGIGEDRLGSWQLQIGLVQTGLNRALEACRLWLAEESADEPPIARWLTVGRSEKGRPEIRLEVSPSWAATWLRENLWNRVWGVALVSATLRALDRFDHYRSLAGLDGKVPEKVFDSVLDYRRQADLVVPWMANLPGGGREQEQAWLREMAELLPALLPEEEGALVLFTSRVAMRETYRHLPSAFRGRVLMQGNGLSQGALIEAHAQRIAQGRGSVIFGLASFAEGVDLPGELCRHLVITRLPFPPFDHPVARNVKEWLGRDHFRRMSLPQASIRLIQACGRLLRNESDRGRILILDRRILLKRYGLTLLEHLPPYRRQLENSQMEVGGRNERSPAVAGTLIF